MEQNLFCPYCATLLEGEYESCPHCGQEVKNTNPSGSLPVGARLAERYIIGKLRTVDGEGVVYNGIELQTQTPVVIKEYLPVTLSAERGKGFWLRPKAGSEVLFKTTRMDFSELYHALCRITPLEGLQTVLNIFEENNTAYAVMEQPMGQSLEHWLEKRGGHIRPEEAVQLLAPIFEGTMALHHAGMVHRGISPETIRITKEGRAYLSGYATVGLRTVGSGLHEQLFEGYSAPEQYSSSEFEGRYTDEYSLAAVFYRMICGQSPVPAGERLVSDSNPTVKQVRHQLSEDISELLELALRIRPAERIQTVHQLRALLSSQEERKEFLCKRKETERERRRKEAEQRRTEHSTGEGILVALKGILAGILVVLMVLTLVTIWGLMGQKQQQEKAESIEEKIEVPIEVQYVPDFLGLTYAQVQANQEYAGRFLFRVTEEYDSEAPRGTIIRQEPTAGEILGEDSSTVQIVLSKGPELVTMPYIIGFPQESAVKELAKNDLVASCFMVFNDGSYASGCVVQCSAEVGEQLESGSTVTVYIAADRDVETAAPLEEQVQEQTAETPTEGEVSSTEEVASQREKPMQEDEAQKPANN